MPANRGRGTAGQIVSSTPTLAAVREERCNGAAAFRIPRFGVGSLRRAVTQYIEHYHAERNHQGLENRLVQPTLTAAANDGSVRRRERLGGILNYYYRPAA